MNCRDSMTQPAVPVRGHDGSGRLVLSHGDKGKSMLTTRETRHTEQEFRRRISLLIENGMGRDRPERFQMQVRRAGEKRLEVRKEAGTGLETEHSR